MFKHWHIDYIMKTANGIIFGCRPRVTAPNERVARRALELQLRAREGKDFKDVEITFIEEAIEDDKI